ncbi:FAD-linked oxidoreductase [Agrocybe pediades]|nr:FAD-linked oxidoreductase [Agrocybe pediades]
MCSVPVLVDASPKILSVLSSIPGVKQITEAFVRVTFFNQFVGADSAEEAIPLLKSLRAANRGVLFAYSVEVDEDEASGASGPRSSVASDSDPSSSSTHSFPSDAVQKRIVEETIHCIDVAADFESQLARKGSKAAVMTGSGRRTWVAVKMTALVPDAGALIALSSYIIESRKSLKGLPETTIPFPGSARTQDLDVLSKPSLLSPFHVHCIQELYSDLHRICTRAREMGVKVIVDAEYSWYQPAIDALTLALMREFNAMDGKGVQPLVYGTFQAYLRRTPAQLALAIEDAKRNHYSLGAKLVRGAYHPHEIAAHQARASSLAPGSKTHASLSISPDVEPPVWTTKPETDKCYNECVQVLIKAVKEDVERSSGRRSKSKLVDWKSDSGMEGTEKKGWFGSLWGGPKEISKGLPEQAKAATSVPGIGVLFGTHNWESCSLIMKELVRNGLAVDAENNKLSSGDDGKAIRVDEDVVERVAIGQLYGMCDDLTDWVVGKIKSSTPFVIKYVPYGALADVMPYLSRRAIENKSVLGGEGGAAHERQRARKEIIKRLFG